MKPDRLGVDPNSSDAAKIYKHWLRTFNNFIDSVLSIISGSSTPVDKLNLLINYTEPIVYDFVSECVSFDEALRTLESIYVKLKNVIFARHLLSMRKQKSGENLDQFLNNLKTLAKDCNFSAVKC